MAQKRKIVRIESNSNSILYAINASLDEFRFCNAVNEEFGISLQMQQLKEYELVNGTFVFHSYYSSIDENKKLQFDIISNKTQKGVIIDFMDSINYFIRISNLFVDAQLFDIQSKIASLESVMFVQKLDITKFTQKQRNQLLHLFF